MRITLRQDTDETEGYQVWASLEAGNVTTMSESFIIGTGETPEAAVVDALETLRGAFAATAALISIETNGDLRDATREDMDV